ncbi:MAG: sn-glycerol-3-phosphate ABC transporter ATP-binding protein UgpC [Alphaproteobacteria bacterium]|nr:sn-glycerol-3-phosphate ABC transporter ATP-binding protein UgpC [Alphaproteobacteria bacterium]
MARISLRHVEKRYGEVPVLFDCNLEIANHEFVVLVGPSGSGKTTLLRLIAGLEFLSKGEIYFDDTCVNDIDVSDRDVAMVFQNYGLYPHMTVYNNMAFGLRRRRMPAAQIDKRVRETARMLNMEPFLSRLPKQLSGGQRQRVALGRAIVRDPAVFLLDEPLSNLDAHLRVRMRAEILKVHRAVTATAIYVTHDQVEAMTMGDRIVVMNEGRIHQVGTPDELYDRPVDTFVAAFIGTPPIGFLTVEARDADGRVELANAAARITLSSAQSATLKAAATTHVTVGIRPERLALGESNDKANAGVVIRGTAEIVEVLGAEQYVHVAVNGESVTAKVSRDRPVRAGEALSLIADTRNLHVFDCETGKALR